MIKREGTKFILLSEDGRRKLGEFDTIEEARALRDKAAKRIKAISKSSDKSTDKD